MVSRDLLVALVAGVLQGIVEWLPISSQGNLTLFLTAIGTSPDIAVRLALFLQVGTTLSATIYYRDTVLAAIRDAPEWRPQAAFDEPNAETSFVVVATAMTGLVGIPIYALLIDFAGELTSGAFIALIGALLILTGMLQYATESVSLGGRGPLSLSDAVLVGAFQGLTILPGVSRSGTTASVLLFRGHNGPSAFRLSFLLSIPAGLGAGVLTALDAGGLPAIAPGEAAVALLTSAAVGYVAIDAIMRVVSEVEFWVVCVALGGLALLGGGLTVAL